MSGFQQPDKSHFFEAVQKCPYASCSKSEGSALEWRHDERVTFAPGCSAGNVREDALDRLGATLQVGVFQQPDKRENSDKDLSGPSWADRLE